MPATIGEFVRVVNKSDNPVTFRWNKREFIARPGRDCFASFEAIKVRLGDPRSMPQKVKRMIDENTTEYIPSRQDELDRLAIMYGMHGDADPNDMALLSSRMPNVEVFTLDGERLVFPPEDPECRQLMPVDDDMGQNEYLMRQIAQMQNQINAFKAMAANLSPEQSPDSIPTDSVQRDSPSESFEVPEDNPAQSLQTFRRPGPQIKISVADED